MSRDRMVKLAMDLMVIGVSQSGVQELLMHELDEVERQLSYLPYRKAKRPEAFIIQAVRKRYSPPKEFFINASNHAHPSTSSDTLDKGSESFDRPPVADPTRHGITDHLSPSSSDSGLEPGGSISNGEPPLSHEEHWSPVSGAHEIDPLA